MAICLTVGAAIVSIAANHFTLSWTHSVERILWQEDWQAIGQTLQLTQVRVRGSGAGMEVPDGAVLKDGVWYGSVNRIVPALKLSISPYGHDEYQICLVDQACQPIPTLFKQVGALPRSTSYMVTVAPCVE